ncbi:hypothetical protein JI747_018970 [Chryseobacterium sp. RG1]|uniref:DUF1700 domain-containing protein n=1 Tax=Chryseobacterium tagetis TaxID=2801334 RepID=A0ABS8A5K9_9FLAO|nr:hypothetical protein [Chryseobacterium tagetis]MCA6069253.1 hypothetical protein [Chryseobacterium tagetis]
MMSVEHKKEIRNYLLSKKIPLDILIEVEDHFISQIEILMSKTTSFEKSFEEVKQAWKKDLTLTKNFGKEIPVFVKDIKDKAMIRIFWKSLLVFFVMNGSVLVLSKVLEKETFSEIFPFLVSTLTSIPSILFLWYIRYFNYVGQFKKIKFNIFQSSHAIVILVGAFQPFLLGQYGKVGAQIYSWFEQGSLIGLLSLIIFSGFVGLYSYGFFILLGFVKSMKKMKPYLKTFNL